MLQSWVYFHPRQYRQILIAAMTVLTLSGLVNAVQPWAVRWQSERAITARAAAGQPAPVAEAATQPVAETVGTMPGSLPSYRLRDSQTNPAELARTINAAWFGDQHWPALQALWMRESGFNPNSRNVSSGACGIPQALPCGKITDHTTAGQITWGLGYIQSRYGNPTNAWRFWQLHHWY